VPGSRYVHRMCRRVRLSSDARRITISVAFAAGLAALPLSAAKAQYYPPCSPFPLAWPFCVAGAVVATAVTIATAPILALTRSPPFLFYGPPFYPPPPYYPPLQYPRRRITGHAEPRRCRARRRHSTGSFDPIWEPARRSFWACTVNRATSVPASWPTNVWHSSRDIWMGSSKFLPKMKALVGADQSGDRGATGRACQFGSIVCVSLDS
jgi:hypothetical protein